MEKYIVDIVLYEEIEFFYFQNDPHKAVAMRSPRGIDISSELAELARSRMREVRILVTNIFFLLFFLAY